MTLKPARRALFLTSNFPRWEGDSTTPFVLHLASDLTRHGWEIDVLAPHAPGAARLGTIQGVRVARFRYWWPESGETVCYEGGALVNLRRRPREIGKVPALVASEAVAAVRAARTRRYDLIHAHWILPQGLVGVLASRAARIPLVVSVHGGDVFDLQGRGMAPLKRFTLVRADAVTFNSTATQRAGEALVSTLRLVRRIPMGVSTKEAAGDTVSELRRSYRAASGPLVVFVGRLVDEKGYEDVLRAVALLYRDAPHCRAVLCGDGQERAEAERLARALGVHDRVTFTGWVDNTEVAAWFQAADVVVLPSRTGPGGWVEAQGLAIIEAMAVGAAVVTTTVGGIPDVAIDGVTALVAPERDPEALCKAILRLHQDQALRRRLGAAAQRAAHERFSREATGAAFARLYNEVCADPRLSHSSKVLPARGSLS